MEYFDVLNIPINKLFMVGVNISNNVVELYLNSKIRYVFYLKDTADYKNNTDLYAKQSPTFDGSIYNLIYLPTFIEHKKIMEFYNNKPNLEERQNIFY